MQMPAPAPSTGGRVQVTRTEYTLWRRRLPGWLVETWLRTQTALLYLFLYAPIAVVVLFSFNDSRRVTIWGGFTTRWYQAAWTSPDVSSALKISLTVALLNAALAVILGTLAALGMRTAPRWLRVGFEGMVYMTIITPEIVIAIASLLYFVNLNIDLLFIRRLCPEFLRLRGRFNDAPAQFILPAALRGLAGYQRGSRNHALAHTYCHRRGPTGAAPGNPGEHKQCA